MSLTSHMGPVFGGAWLPMESEAQPNATIIESSPPAVRAWMEACQRQQPGSKRGDPAPVQLECPHVSTCENLPCGIYDTAASGQTHTEMRSHVSLALQVPMQTDIFQKPKMMIHKQHNAVKDLPGY